MVAAPRLVYWEVTKRCNLQCMHCRAVPVAQAAPDELSLGEGFRLIEGIRAVGRPVLVFTGGEPLLRPDLFDLAAFARWCGLRIALATNGTILTPALADRVARTGFRRVSISLDGPDAPAHDRFRRVDGAFERAVEGVRALQARGMSMQVNTTVTTLNRSRLEEIYGLVKQLGADAWHLFLLVPVGCGLAVAPECQLTPQEYEDVLLWIDGLAAQETMQIHATCAPHIQRIRLQRMAAGQGLGAGPLLTRSGCLAGTGICFVSCTGEVFPCGYLPVPAGNVRRESFARIWGNSPVLRTLRDPNALVGKCGRCVYRVACGGCRARAFGQTGDYLQEEPFCGYAPDAESHRGAPPDGSRGAAVRGTAPQTRASLRQVRGI